MEAFGCDLADKFIRVGSKLRGFAKSDGNCEVKGQALNDKLRQLLKRLEMSSLTIFTSKQEALELNSFSRDFDCMITTGQLSGISLCRHLCQPGRLPVDFMSVKPFRSSPSNDHSPHISSTPEGSGTKYENRDGHIDANRSLVPT
jgi:hypothetical protein